jgi:hypothetical protein
MEPYKSSAESKRSVSSESQDVIKDYNYFKLFPVAERQLWKVSDIPWDKIDKQAVPSGLLSIIRELAYAELTTYTATQKFMELFADDLDFTSWLSIWFYEESKHPLVLMKWLSYFGDQFDASYIRKGREIHPMRDDRLEMLCMNIISEVMAAQAYSGFSTVVKEPALNAILHLLSVDETRHANSFYVYARALLNKSENKVADRLSALRVLFYCLYSMEQHHPVNEFVMRVRGQLADSSAQLGMDNPDVQKILLHKFSQLTGLQLASKQDIIGNIQELRSEAGETNASGN